MGLKVVVTGGSGGIGRATALRFANDGHEVFITGRSDAKLAETVNLARGEPAPTNCFPGRLLCFELHVCVANCLAGWLVASIWGVVNMTDLGRF